MSERLQRDDLIELVRVIMAGSREGETEEEADRLVYLFEANVRRRWSSGGYRRSG